MRLVNYLLVTTMLAACNAKPPIDTASQSETAKTTTQPTSALDNRLVVIERFDCFKSDDVDNGNYDWPQGLSQWNAGGPGGASWNAATLICVVESRTACTQGEIQTELRIGGALISAQNAPALQAGAQQVKIQVSREQWEEHLDQTSPLTERLPYRTATLSASVFASCSQPEQLGPGIGPRKEFADDRHFTAGFASGE